MCGRYVIYDQLTKGGLTLLGHDIPANYNVAPTANVPIIRPNHETNEQELIIARFGLIPHWAKNLKIPPFFNARADKLLGNKVFWPSINRPCIFPMAGFYEWAEQSKQPYYIYSPQEPIIYAAGLWNRWQSKEGQSIDSCTIITTTPNETLADIHHRMPVILSKKDHDAWLHDAFEQSKKLLQPYSHEMAKYPVNPKVVNNARNNSMLCLEHWQNE
jgi:putative SOS response-associated peptidase YedK